MIQLPSSPTLLPEGEGGKQFGWVADKIVGNDFERWSVSDDGPRGGGQEVRNNGYAVRPTGRHQYNNYQSPII